MALDLANNRDHPVYSYISGNCSKAIYEKHAGMDESEFDVALMMRGIFRLGAEPVEGGFRCIIVMSNEDISAELPLLFGEIPGPWIVKISRPESEREA